MRVPKSVLLGLFLFCQHALAFDEFLIEQIEVDGLQRITVGTVLNYLPLKKGEIMDEEAAKDSIRVLFKTGFFEKIRLEKEGETLQIILKERPAIGKLTFNGNEKVKTDEIIEALTKIGFVEGRLFDRSLLDLVEQELRKLYFSFGKYAVRIKSQVTDIDDNRVEIVFDISEGRSSLIKQINISGNKVFSDKTLKAQFTLTTPTTFSFFTKNDQYSRQKLSGDLERLRSYYLNRGYAKFEIKSAIVSITPDKEDIYIFVDIHEGDRFRIKTVKLSGELILSPQELFKEVQIIKNQPFSRKRVVQTSTNLTGRLGEIGYAFATITPKIDLDDTTKTASINYHIDPKQRVYVRRINFKGNTKTREEVLRREMRQEESAPVSTRKIERGKVRLERLGYFDGVDVNMRPLPDSEDTVDIDYTVEERRYGSLSLGVGFSQGEGIIFQSVLKQENFLGSGRAVSFGFNNSSQRRSYVLSYNNPYYTTDGVSRGFTLSRERTFPGRLHVSRYETDRSLAAVNFGIPVSEYNFLGTQLSVENTSIIPSSSAPSEVLDYVRRNGRESNLLRWRMSFGYDSRNKAILPDAGVRHEISTQVALPVLRHPLSFYKVDYEFQLFQALPLDHILSLRTSVSYGAGYGSNRRLPFFEHYFAGGPRSVRGFEEYSLGPTDSTGRALGGNMRLTGSAELILPIPFLSDIKSVRVTAFTDAGNAYDTRDKVQLSDLRYSAGLSFVWVSQFGALSVSYGYPLNARSEDRIQRFQFNIGTSF